MAFFNKKEEVIDIQLTRFGKASLAEGSFKPIYYQFFDDDIVYDQRLPAELAEAQNDVQERILKNTPRNKPHVNVFLRPFLESKFSIDPAGALSQNEKFYCKEEQDRILLYPLSNYESNSEESTFFNVRAYDCSFSAEPVKFSHYTKSGIYKKIPQLKMDSTHTITRIDGIDLAPEELRAANNTNNFIDLRAESVTFLDSSVVKITGDDLVLSVEEGNTYYNVENFELEIYEVDETATNDDSSILSGPGLKRIENIDDINKLFHIKTDIDVQSVKTKFGRQNNWYRTGE